MESCLAQWKTRKQLDGRGKNNYGEAILADEKHSM